MREGARERGSGREEQTAERESVGGKMLTLLLHLDKRQIEGNKGGKKRRQRPREHGRGRRKEPERESMCESRSERRGLFDSPCLIPDSV